MGLLRGQRAAVWLPRGVHTWPGRGAEIVGRERAAPVSLGRTQVIVVVYLSWKEILFRNSTPVAIRRTV